ncbi:MAG: TraR/DksA family transcriptional regulator [Gammaproteobacteria bacterium]|nr:TraR/DksA family transcriptional regulator [Gammaproteobacteria bacterium]
MTDVSKIKRQLQTELDELNKRAQSIDDDLGEPADDDWEEEAVEAAGDEVLEEVGEVTLEEIAQIKHALAQIEAGRYGICSKCGDVIAKARLAALPSATECIKCA